MNFDFNLIGKTLSSYSFIKDIPHFLAQGRQRAIEFYNFVSPLPKDAYNFTMSLARKITPPPLKDWSVTNAYNYLFKR